jgi:mitogen-activated protein kinase 1/3
MSGAPVRSIADLQAEIDRLDPRYQVEKIIGNGSYGMVLRARDMTDNCIVAIKRINQEIFTEPILAKRILREVKLLAHFHDDNIVGMRNLLTPSTEDFTEFFLVMDVMETDLKHVFKSNQKLTDAHIQFFIYQGLRALNIVHAAGVIHRDITPANVLVNTNCDLKLCDFGLAKEETVNEDMTDYVTMRWYRAPELVMEYRHYDGQVDVWGMGCILAELLGSKPLFPGKDRVNQIDKIIEVTGTPNEEDLSSIGSAAAQKYVRKKVAKPPMNYAERFPDANPQALDLLSKMLQFHPRNRITVKHALAHPYLHDLHDEAEENIDPGVFAFNEHEHASIADIKRAIVHEAIKFHRANPRTRPPKGFEFSLSGETLSPEGRTGDSHMNKREMEGAKDTTFYENP